MSERCDLGSAGALGLVDHLLEMFDQGGFARSRRRCHTPTNRFGAKAKEIRRLATKVGELSIDRARLQLVRLGPALDVGGGQVADGRMKLLDDVASGERIILADAADRFE